MKSIFKLIKWTILLLVLAAIFHNWTLKTALAFGLRLGLGAPVDIEAARLDFFAQKVAFEGILLKNPANFPHGILAEIPKITVSFDAAELQERRLRLKEVAVEIEDVRVVRAAGGKMNLLGLKVFKPRSPDSSSQPAPPAGEKPRVQIDRVLISLNRVTYTDLSGPNSVQQSFRLGIRDAVLENQPRLEDIVEAVVQESIQAAGLQRVLEEGIRSFGLRSLEKKDNVKSLVEKIRQVL